MTDREPAGPEGWRVAVDRGGTFTDVVATGPAGQRVVRKVLSREAEISAAIADLAPGEVRVGTTVATNALLTRRGARTALLITAGFGDLPWIGDQTRPDLFELNIQRVAPLCEVVVEVAERLLPDGTVERPVDSEALRPRLAELKASGIECCAVVLVHGFLHDVHERQVAALVEQAGLCAVRSSQVAPEAGLVVRASTTVAEGFTRPVLRAWTGRMAARVGGPLVVMKSSGGLARPEVVGGVDAVLSGPAGGVVACAAVARELGLPQVLGFDMGGTSTDVCRWAGRLERTAELTVAGQRLRTRALEVHTVAAGGGSCLAVVDGRARVGPSSAGADPGPACYGSGGPAAVTDANVVLGRVPPDRIAPRFGPTGDRPLDAAASRASLGALGADPEEVAAGFLAVADATMAAAIAELSTARGHDPREHTLIAFGGAAGQHACSVAERLGVQRIVVHPLAGVLSAYGIGRASESASRRRPVLEPWTEQTPERLAPLIAAVAQEARDELGETSCTVEHSLDLRYVGSTTVLSAADRASFEAAHARLFGFVRPAAAVEVVQIVVEATTTPPPAEPRPPRPPARPLPPPTDVRRVGHPDGEGRLRWRQTPVFARHELVAGARGPGPLLVVDPTTTVVVDPGWSLAVGAGGEIVLERSAAPERAPAAVDDGVPDVVRLELFWRRFSSVASRMGHRLRRVAWSVNIKERLDFSCAVFDPFGRLVTNAPHIPVHLGAMGETVRRLAARLGDELKPGRSWAVNDPLQGGSHLPDITVITPVFRPGRTSPLAWVASRGHHQDIGGTTPGSMPPDSTSLAEEGVVLSGLLIASEGRFASAAVRRALAAGPWPARDPDTVEADLQAQVAAGTLGARLIAELADSHGDAAVEAWMGHILDHGAAVVQDWLAAFDQEPRRFADRLDDGTPIAVELRVAEGPTGRELHVAFDGTGPASTGNLNAPRAITRAAVLYAIRCAVGRDLPLNDGCLRPVHLHVPTGSILDPPAGAAVVGGNVETSQRVVDVLLGALDLAAASQGTMNNLTLGDEQFGYYETIAGGAGATPEAAGASAVHTHMTNTRMTDVEVLERRCPLLVRELSIRRGSGGAGRFPGGDGLRRVLQPRRPLRVSLLAQRRTTAPFGLHGGDPGRPGSASRLRDDGLEETLLGSFSITAEPSDRIVIESPGGGGWGSANPQLHNKSSEGPSYAE